MRILVTAGPTREFLDPVRFMSNRSTGRLGYAIASAARRRGHAVTLVSGPVELPEPADVEIVPIISAADLARETLGRLPEVDAVVMTAAVADYTFSRTESHKIKKTAGPITLTLVPTTDVLAEIGKSRRADQVIMGFALETDNGPAEAARKLVTKNCDFLVLNGPGNFGDVNVSVTVLARDGRTIDLTDLAKPQLAERLVELLEAAFV